MLEEPYNFYEEHYKKYSHIDNNKENFQYTYIKDLKCLQLLGEGSFSSVYEVLDEKNNKKFAVKVCKKDDEDVSKNEITILRKIGKHKNIIELYDTFYLKNKQKKEKNICMKLENLGCDLNVLKRLFKYNGEINNNIDSCSSISDNETIKQIKIGIPIKLSKKIGYQILEALKYIHDKNIIHTDLKLENILITENLNNIHYNEDINIKLCDFGTSHQIDKKCNYNIGTIDYSAPECIIGVPYGKKIDIWAFGCILYEIITGSCLFDYTRYYDDASEISSGYTSESNEEDENDKTQIEFLLLCMMKIILGSFPSKIFKKGKYYDNYFDYKGRLRFFPNFLEEDELINKLINEFNLENNIATEINDFLLKCLNINPDYRDNTENLLKNNFFNDKY